MDERMLRELFQVDSVYVEYDSSGANIVTCRLSIESHPDVEAYYLQLCGINPMSGNDISQNAKTRISVGKYNNSVKFDPLRYHGHYEMHCIAKLKNGTQITFLKEPIELVYEPNRPKLTVKRVEKNRESGLLEVTVESNCWHYYKNKPCIICDGRRYFPGITNEASDMQQLLIKGSKISVDEN